MIGKIGPIQPYLINSSTTGSYEIFSSDPNIEKVSSEPVEFSAATTITNGGYTQPSVLADKVLIKV